MQLVIERIIVGEEELEIRHVVPLRQGQGEVSLSKLDEAAVAGTSPVLFESGAYSKAHRRYACIKPLHNALYEFAWQSIQQETWARNYYQRKRTEGKSHSEALRALSNNWLRIIHAMWRNKKEYVSAIFELAQQRHAQLKIA